MIWLHRLNARSRSFGRATPIGASFCLRLHTEKLRFWVEPRFLTLLTVWRNTRIRVNRGFVWFGAKAWLDKADTN